MRTFDKILVAHDEKQGTELGMFCTLTSEPGPFRWSHSDL